MIKLEYDPNFLPRLGDTIAYESPVHFTAADEEEMDKQLRQALIHMAGGEMPDYINSKRIQVTLDKECLRFEDIKDADFYTEVGDKFLYRTER